MGVVKSWMEISGERLAGNLRAVQTAAGTEVEVLAVVKANGYGHGAALVAKVLVEAGGRWLGVNDVDEGVRVRAACPDVRMLVMCAMELRDASALVAHGLTPVVWTIAHVEAMEAAAKVAGKPTAVHVEVDTGMSRQGVMPGEALDELLGRLMGSKWVECEGLMSHLCCSEIVEARITVEQRERFGKALEQARRAGVQVKFVHLGNTSAVDEGSTTAWVSGQAARLGARAMVRTGLAIYGHCLPVGDEAGGSVEHGTRLQQTLLPVETWKTRVVGLREIMQGTTVGYGATFVAKGTMRLALLPVGYADGFRREASSGVGDGWVMVAGKKARVAGRVSMNLMTVDVTGMEVAVGDEVVLMGEGVSAEVHAQWCGTIPYDVLCGVKTQGVLV